jgi:3-oxoacyl-[acyl-carrier protein] reductase
LVGLTGKKALVTGAGKGIGRGIATALAARGVHVGLLARTAADLEALAAELRQTHGVTVAIATADVADRLAVEAAVTTLRDALGGLDIVINNAGIAQGGTVLTMEPEDWERHFAVNVFGVYYVTRAVLPAMIAQGSGDIVNVASTAGDRGAATLSAYSASKAAVLRFTESVAQEVRKHNIRVSSLLPSTVNTEMAASLGLKIGSEDRMMQSADVADLVVSILELPQRVFVRDVSILTTNPQ